MSCNDSCSASAQHYVGDIGTEIIVDTCSDISTATLVSLKVMKPDGTTHTWVGAVYEGTKIRYVVVAGDFNQEGEYRVQPYIEMPGWRGNGDTATFRVYQQFQ